MARDISRLYPTKSAKLISYTTSTKKYPGYTTARLMLGKKLYDFWKTLRFKINFAVGFYQKKSIEMHWLTIGCNDAVPWLNKVKTRIQPTANFENFEYFFYLSAVRPSCARCRVPEILRNKGNGRFIKMLFRK